jgi:hypothetical protein
MLLYSVWAGGIRLIFAETLEALVCDSIEGHGKDCDGRECRAEPTSADV